MASHFQGFFLCWCSYFTSEGSQGVAGTHGLAQLKNKEGKGEWFRDGTLKTDLFQPLPWKGEGELHRAQLKLGGNPIFPELQQPLYHTPAFSSTLIKQFPPAAPHSSVHIPKPWSPVPWGIQGMFSRQRQGWEQPHRTSQTSCASAVTTADKVITPLQPGNVKSTGLHCCQCCWLQVNYQILNSHGREPPANRSATNLLH